MADRPEHETRLPVARMEPPDTVMAEDYGSLGKGPGDLSGDGRATRDRETASTRARGELAYGWQWVRRDLNP